MKIGGVIIVLAAITAAMGIFFADEQVAGAMSAVADNIFGLFRNKTFPLLLAASILVVALTMVVGYGLFIVLPQSLHLRTLSSRLAKVDDERAFAREYDEISAYLVQSQMIGHAWKEFTETLVLPTEGRPVVQNTTRPHTFINYHCAQDRSVALRMMPHVPNYFVGVGLLLTFVGLVAALYFANTAVGGDIDEAVKGLQDLLAAATFKFWTSIAGLLASIVLSFVFRLYSMHLEGCFASLCRALEEHMLFATPQRIFVDVRDTIVEQLAETKKINTEVAMSIGDSVGRQFREHIPDILVEALKPLVDAVEATSNKVGQGATDGVERMVEQFAQTIEGSAGKHMHDLSLTLEELQKSLSVMQGSMGTSGEEFARRMAEGSERLDGTMRDVATAIRDLIEGLRNELGQAGQAFGGNLEKSLERLVDLNERMTEDMAGQSRHASASFAAEVEKAAKALSGIANDNTRTSAESTEQLRAAMRDVADGMKELIGSLRSEVGQAGQEFSSGIGESLALIMEHMAHISKAMAGQGKTASASFAADVEKAGQALSDIASENTKASAEATEQLRAAMRDVADGMKALIGGLQTEVGQAGQAFGSGIDDTLTRLGRHSERMTEELGEQSRQVSASFAAEVMKAARILSGTTNDNARSAVEFAGQLRSVLGDGVDGVREGLDRMAGSLSTLDAQLVQQGTQLAAVSERSRDTAKAMADAAESIRTGIEPFQEVGRTLAESGRSVERAVGEIAGRMELASRTVQEVGSHLGDVSTSLQNAWENYRARFEGVDRDLENTFLQLTEAVQNQQRLVQDFVKQLDTSFSSAINSLSGGIDGINASVEDLTDALEKAGRDRAVRA